MKIEDMIDEMIQGEYHYLNKQELEVLLYKCEDLVRAMERELKQREKYY